jgi:hypothetical protein
MKCKTNEVADLLQENLSEIQASGNRYQLRTECRLDCEHIRGLLRPWILSWKESSRSQFDDSYIGENNVMWASMNWTSETNVIFILYADGPNLSEVRWFIENLTDCHFAAESVNIAAKYTGQRIAPTLLESKMTVPSKAMILMAMRALVQQQERSEYSAEKAGQAWDALSEVIDLRSTWSQTTYSSKKVKA